MYILLYTVYKRFIACVYSAVGCQNGRNQRAHRTLHHPFKSSSVNLRWLQSKSSKVWQNGNFGNILCWSGSKMCHNVPDSYQMLPDSGVVSIF